jgi:predicted methyltransferase
MDEGYIFSNKFRRAVFDELASGEKDIKWIAKKHRIVLGVVKKVVDEFIREGILEERNNRYFFTKEGEKLVANIRG